MAPDDDLWDAQLRRLLAGYREPQLDARRMDAIGRRVADRLKEDGVLEANLESLLPPYEEPEISKARLDEIGERLAGMLAPAPQARPRPTPRIRVERPPNDLLWAAIGIAAAFLIVALVATPKPDRTPTKTIAKTAPPPILIPTPPIEIVDPEKPPVPPPPQPPVVAREPLKPEAPLLKPDPIPAPAPPPPERTPAPTLVAPALATVATVERVEGTVEWVGATARKPVTAGLDIPAQATVETGKAARILLKYKDGTSLDLGPGAVVQFLAPPSGAKELSLVRGALAADVAPQPAGKPLVIATPMAEARVLGTQFLISADPGSTRLDVREGKVRFTRKPDGAVVDVAAGTYSVAARGIALLTRPIPEESKRLLIEVEELASARGTKPADGMIRRLFLEPFDAASGGWCVSAPAAGMEAAGDFKLAKGTWYVWVRYRDEPGNPRIAFNVLLGDQILGQLSTPGRDRNWIWKRVAFPWNGGAARVTLRSTFDGVKATPDRSDFRQSPYGALNRWDRICLTPDEAYTPD